MPVVVPVKFAFASRELWFDPKQLDIMAGDHAICSTERGTEIGLVTADPFEVPASELAAPLKPVLRVATDDDLDYADELADRGEDAMRDFRRIVARNELDMKPVAVEYLFGGEKAVFYFAAEDRVDFRQLVRDLSSFFHVRVDMRQIGVRDETRLVGGYATCGQELCCTRFGGQFEPVSIRMAKEQDLPLNSSKISGVCGRLMCCLRYEFEAYKDFKSRAPKKKALIDTPLGKAKVQEYNTPREELILRLENGKVFRVNLADMTCSDGCKKKASEQGCACRPDCVTRDVLERIESADIALALLELDRENGVDTGDGLDRADRIAASGPTPRRRRRSAANEGAEQAQGTSRRNALAQQQDGSTGSSRRRRRHLSGEERDAAFLNAARAEQKRSEQPGTAGAEGQPTESGRSRRRHTSKKPEVASVAEQISSGDIKVTRRRPGDGGGAAAEKRAAGRGDKRSDAGTGGKRSDAARPEARRSNGAPEDGAAEGAPKKRRRRRSRKPKQGGGEAPRGGAADSGSADE